MKHPIRANSVQKISPSLYSNPEQSYGDLTIKKSVALIAKKQVVYQAGPKNLKREETMGKTLQTNDE